MSERHVNIEHQKLLNASGDWLRYAIQLKLCHEPKRDLTELRSAAVSDTKIQGFLHDVANYHSIEVANHKNPDLPIHKLQFFLDLGFDTDIPDIQTAIEEILKHKDEDGIYQSLTNIPVHFGGTGTAVFSWSLCDAPLLLLALFKAGIDYHTYLKPGVDFLLSLHRENGFPCAASRELGRFRGPGRKEDCCPYATLIMAKLLAHIPEYRSSPEAATAVEALLALWAHSREQHPYIFYMGNDFRKLKAPSHWYDILSVAGVVSRYPHAHTDSRFQEMVEIITSKQDNNGFFVPESVYQKMRNWDFGQKKAPSPYLTYLCQQLFDRLLLQNGIGE